MTLLEYRQTPIYTDFFRLRDDDHTIILYLPDGPPNRTLRLVFFRGRGEPDFTERDRALLILLQPHLHAAHMEVRKRRRGTPALTRRQWQLLRLVDEGLTNSQIARHLHISEHTVRKHLENIFERLNVASRTEAVAFALPARPLVVHAPPAV
jgi:DNA-binding CsgD family transcriptional regulator